MAIQTIGLKDATGTTKNVAVSDALGGGNLANAFYLVNGTTEVGSGNALPVSLATLPALATGSNVIGKTGIQVGGSDVSESNPVNVRGVIRNPSVTLTLPNSTTTYAVGDLVANSATAGSVTALSWDCGSGSFMITGLVVQSNRTATTSVGSFRLHLYSAAPTVDTTGDDGVYADNVNIGSARYLGAIDFNYSHKHKDGHGGSGIPFVRPYFPVKLASGTTIYGLVEARANYARTQVSSSSETMTILLDVIPNT